MNPVEIHLAGEPPRQTHQSRLRAYRIGKFCRIVKAKPDAATERVANQIAAHVQAIRKTQPTIFPADVPLAVILAFHFPFPAAVKARDRKATSWRTQRPDLDNLSKSILDALTDAGAWADDAQVVDLTLKKTNSPTPRLSIYIQPVQSYP
jgi:Holliday junction resolvase RusA-like endonuclease